MDSLTKAQNEEIFQSELDFSIVIKTTGSTVFGYHLI